MKTTYRIVSATSAAVAASLWAAAAVAVPAPSVTEVTVEVPRVVSADPTRPGTPYEVILRGHVSYADLDLAKTADGAVLEQRIKDKALAICGQIGKEYPASRPSTADCAKLAADHAMVQAKKVIAAAAKGTN